MCNRAVFFTHKLTQIEKFNSIHYVQLLDFATVSAWSASLEKVELDELFERFTVAQVFALLVAFLIFDPCCRRKTKILNHVVVE